MAAISSFCGDLRGTDARENFWIGIQIFPRRSAEVDFTLHAEDGSYRLKDATEGQRFDREQIAQTDSLRPAAFQAAFVTTGQALDAD